MFRRACAATLAAGWLLASGPAQAQAEPLRILGQERQFVVPTPAGPVTITRHMTPCARNKGFLQPLVPAPGVNPATEIEVLRALNDPAWMVVDMRDEDTPLEATLPNAYHIPYNEVEDRMPEFGCKQLAKYRWDCRAAPQVLAYCNGPVCTQSPMGISTLIEMGFEPAKIWYYRGGMLDWEALGLTTVRGNRPPRR